MYSPKLALIHEILVKCLYGTHNIDQMCAMRHIDLIRRNLIYSNEKMCPQSNTFIYLYTYYISSTSLLTLAYISETLSAGSCTHRMAEKGFYTISSPI